ncbi:MAG: hypothetical protein VYE73_11210 [Acidobacteriota bacterium]|nr:hypothetical protein [Acidobacteriota bacterium]
MSFLAKQLEDPVRLRRIKRGFYVSLGVVAGAEIALPLLLGGGHPHFSFEGWPAWGSLYGLISCVAIIVVSKLIGKVWLMRGEDYYDS